MKKDTAIILPVYNEDLKLLRDLIEDILKTLPHSAVIIIDDSKNSNLRKRELLTHFHKNTPLHIFTRSKKLGRGSAVLKGFEYAVTLPVKFIIEMDSDYSHDPKDLLLLLKEIEKGKTDVVIGSRYLKKSKINKWPRYRLILSKIINIFLEILLQVGLSDYTNGLRLYSKKAIFYLLKKKPKENGFILLSETAYLLKKGNFVIRETPITFTDRKKGKSSVKGSDLLTSLFSALKIRLTKYD